MKCTENVWDTSGPLGTVGIRLEGRGGSTIREEEDELDSEFLFK